MESRYYFTHPLFPLSVSNFQHSHPVKISLVLDLSSLSPPKKKRKAKKKQWRQTYSFKRCLNNLLTNTCRDKHHFRKHMRNVNRSIRTLTRQESIEIKITATTTGLVNTQLGMRSEAIQRQGIYLLQTLPPCYLKCGYVCYIDIMNLYFQKRMAASNCSFS